MLGALLKLFEILSIALQSCWLYNQFIVEATEAQRRNGVSQGYGLLVGRILIQTQSV